MEETLKDLVTAESSLTEIARAQTVCDIVSTYERLRYYLQLDASLSALALGILVKKQDPEFTTQGELALLEACKGVAIEKEFAL